MKVFLVLGLLFISVSSKGLLLPFGADFGDVQATFSWWRWSEDPGIWCYPISFGNHTFIYFNRSYTRANICYGSLVFTDTAKVLSQGDNSCQPPMLDYDALFPFHYVAEHGYFEAYYRIETGKVARREINLLMRSVSGQSSSIMGNFEASWAFVVTWDIKAWEYGLEATVQAVLFCDEQTVTPNCYAAYSYGDESKIPAFDRIENRVGAVGWMRGPQDSCQDDLCTELSSTRLSWEADLWLLCLLGFHSSHLVTAPSYECNNTVERQSCVNIRENMRNAGLFHEITSSRTPEIRYLPLKSNVDVPGVFLFPLSGQKSPETETDLEFLEIQPKTVYIYAGTGNFSKSFWISGFPCTVKLEVNFEVLFSGESYSVRMPATCENKSIITGLLPFWTRTGDVLAYLYKNNRLASQPMKLDFPRYELLNAGLNNDKKGLLEISSRNESTHWTTFKWEKDSFGDTAELIPNILYVQDRMEGFKDPFLVTRFVLRPIPNNGSYSLSISSHDFVFIQLMPAQRSTYCQNPTESKSLAPLCGDEFVMNQVPITPTADLSCKHWIEEESEFTTIGGGKWFDGLEKYYACPRRPQGGEVTIAENETDAYFAREEVSHGMGWKYDPCCSHVKSLHVDTMRFCTHCECNEGAEFCIISSPIKIEMERNGTKLIHETTNQCCYNNRGSLITDPDKGAGRASKEINSVYNTFAHYRSDIAPYLSCCKGWKSTTDTCNRFRKQRPVVVGKYYVPCYITMTVVERDPHFRTLDGFQYTFNGLGVYTMLTALNESSEYVELQVSTRRKGNGTVLSGFAMKDNHSMVEGYLPPDRGSDLKVNVNKEKFQLHKFTEIRLDGVEIRQISSTEFVFTLVTCNLQIKVMITDSSILNIATVPPLSMVDGVIGLLGNFDGDPENDLYDKDATLLSSNSTMREIHDSFGESWKVSENDWLFSLEFALQIEKDVQNGMPYEASYEPTFANSEEEIAIKDACDADETCMLDVSLTKDFSFANTTKTIKNLKEKVETISAKYEQTKQTVIQEVRMITIVEKEISRKNQITETPDRKTGRLWDWMTVYVTMGLTIVFLLGSFIIIQYGPKFYYYWKQAYIKFMK